MRLFQNNYVYPSYLPILHTLPGGSGSFAEQIDAFRRDRCDAMHTLLPALEGDRSAFLTNSSDETLQRQWAREQGMRPRISLDEILLAQIEAHKTEVFYDLGPMTHGEGFLERLPGSVKRKIAWYAAPSPPSNLASYDLIVSNFPTILEGYAKLGCRTHFFFPAHDPELDVFAANAHRPIDILFVGTYSRFHQRRAALLEAFAQLASSRSIVFHLNRSRLVKLAESPVGYVLPLAKHRRPAAIRKVSAPPVFGLALYRLLSQAKIVLNVAVDMAGSERGNMRCFEVLGSGALLLSDSGRYPDGMEPGRTLVAYDSPEDAVAKAEAMLAAPAALAAIAAAGHRMVSTLYSKKRQWQCFLELV